MGIDNPTMKMQLWLTAGSAREPEIESDSEHAHRSLLIPSREECGLPLRGHG